ncbi:MAG TPA: TAT-variant-translocated molybdopterin oxidoreductase [bacterium]|nr:TAT-variant-translocated molybdopterin oxidoreductase [bacterium]
MTQHEKRNHYQGLEELNESGEELRGAKEEFPRPSSMHAGDGNVSRRGFLKASGFAIAGSVLAACSRAPVEKAIPHLIKPEEMTPGEASWFASTCHGCTARCGVLVKNRDGRPIKLEGNPEHPLSQGGLCAVGQASVLELYDSRRIQQPMRSGQSLPWDQIDRDITEILEESSGVYLLTGTIMSPSTRHWMDRFLSGFENGGRVEYDPVSCAAIPDAHQETHGVRALPKYRFNRADMILSFGADFLGAWISPVEYARGYGSNRSPEPDHPEMSYHVQYESRMSLTGSNADRRFRVSPAEMRAVLVRLANRLAERTGRPERFGEVSLPIDQSDFDKLVDRLWEARGRSLVISDANELPVQKVINFINQILDNYGETLDIEQPSYQRRGDDQAVRQLLQSMRNGEVGTLIIHGINPAYHLPDSVEFTEALKHVENFIVFASHQNETTTFADYIMPEPHYLEIWDDSMPGEGAISITQPTIPSLNNARTLRRCLAQWSGQSADDYQLLQSCWEEFVYPRRTGEVPFQEFWDYAVHDGFTILRPQLKSVQEFQYQSLEMIPVAEPEPELSLELYESIAMRDGRHAQNPWLQELPDPVTKVTWDNYASVSPALAGEHQLEDGDIIRLTTSGATIELPVLVQPGQHDCIISVALGYGRQGTDRFHDIAPRWIEGKPTVQPGQTIGVNAFPCMQVRNVYTAGETEVRIEPTGEHADLARTQTHQTITIPDRLGGHAREMIREASLDSYRDDPAAGNPPVEEPLQLWPNDFVYEGRHWGMAIDLNKCIGCSACVIGCQAENNVPVVGRDEVRRRREMHWIRIDRYYSGDPAEPETAYQPVMCQHCDHAPCEPVCPVLATVHSEEGINQQIYNRCVGTRYCANNCPYKVRRFNWFKYNHGDERQQLVLNPDVTVRSRGVMEKCSLCVQRIAEAKNEARREGRDLQDGDIQLACQQSCPTDAIVFGDTNDPESEIAKTIQNSRHYRMLEEWNFRPTVGYLAKIRNRPDQPEESNHA